MTTAEFDELLAKISNGKEAVRVDETGLPEIARTLPMFELRQLIVALTKGYNEQHRRIDILEWIARARFNKVKNGGKS